MRNDCSLCFETAARTRALWTIEFVGRVIGSPSRFQCADRSTHRYLVFEVPGQWGDAQLTVRA
jgi:hypothetical protein